MLIFSKIQCSKTINNFKNMQLIFQIAYIFYKAKIVIKTISQGIYQSEISAGRELLVLRYNH